MADSLSLRLETKALREELRKQFKKANRSARLSRMENSNFGTEYGAAYARVETDDGRVVRVETDGNGRLIEFDEGRALGGLYALSLRQIRADRLAVEKIKANTVVRMRAQERHEIVWAAMQEVGSSTSRDLAVRLGLLSSSVTVSLQVLRTRGLVTIESSHNKAGNRVFIWSLVA